MQEGRAQKIALLGEQRREIVAAPFELAIVERQGKAHVAVMGLDIQVFEQGGQVG
jgi:hypothetical protein